MSRITHSSGGRGDGVVASSFNEYFESWLVRQDELLDELIDAAAHHHDHHHQNINDVIERVVQEYEVYYRTKSRWAKDDVLKMMSPTWTSLLENSLLWVGGWRPSMAFRLLHSQFDQTGSGNHPGQLTAGQLSLVDQLHMKTVKEEEDITEKLACHQETVADPLMVELSQVVTDQLMRSGGYGPYEDIVESTIECKEKELLAILQMADDLRLRTLKSVIEILSPVQAVHFLIAGAELHLRLHDWGKKRDDDHQKHAADAET